MEPFAGYKGCVLTSLMIISLIMKWSLSPFIVFETVQLSLSNKKKRKQWKATKESRSSNKTNYCQSQVRVPLIMLIEKGTAQN